MKITKENKRKQFLAILLILAILCTSIPFTQVRSVHASESGQHLLWYDITAKINASWSGYLAGEIILTNTDRQNRQDWQICLPWQAKIISMWNARYQETDQGYLISPMEHNRDIPPKSTVTIGFLAEGNDEVFQSFPSDRFLIQDGTEITDARDRATDNPGPQEKPTPVSEVSPTKSSTSRPTITPVFALVEKSGQCSVSKSVNIAATGSSETETVALVREPATEPTNMSTEIPVTDSTESSVAESETTSTSLSAETATVEPTETSTEEPIETSTKEPIETSTSESVVTEQPMIDPSRQPMATPTVNPVVTSTPDPTTALVPDYPDRYLTSGLILQEDIICGNLYLLDGGFVNLNGHTLTIKSNLWVQSGSRGILGSGNIRLEGDLIQSEQSQNFSLGNDIQLALCGDQPQNIQLVHPEQTRLGLLDLSACKKAYLPEEIHCYSLAGIRNLHMGERLCLAVDQLKLDSDIQIPGNLELVQGSYRTGNYQVGVGGSLYLRETGSPTLNVQEGSSVQVEQDTEIQSGMISISQAEMTVAGNVIAKKGSIRLYGGTFHARKNLGVCEDAWVLMQDGLLKISGNWENNSTQTGVSLQNGTIELCGDLIQQETAGINSMNMNNSLIFCLKGSEPQHICLAHPEKSKLGQLNLNDCREAYLPEEIHCYSLAGIRNLHMGETLRLAVDYLNLDSDIHFPGNLELLQGSYRTGNYQVDVGGSLYLRETGSPTLNVQKGSSVQVEQDTEIQSGMISISQAEMTVAGNVIAKKGSIRLYGGTFHARKNLGVCEDAWVLMQDGLLEISGNWENNSTQTGVSLQNGTIELCGDLIQQETAGINSMNMNNSLVFCLKGSEPQHIRLEHPERSNLGQLDLSCCKEAYLPEEIHCYSLAGIRNLHMGETLQLAVSQFKLDSDIQIPGNLELLQGSYRTGNYQVGVGGSLLLRETALSTLNIQEGSSVQVEGDTEIQNGMISISQAEMTVAGNVIAKKGSIRLYGGTFHARGNLSNQENAWIALQDGLLRISGNWENNSTQTGVSLQSGTIELCGDLIQQETASVESIYMGERMVFCFKGSKPQHIRLAHPLESRFGNLDFGDSAGVILESEEASEDGTLYLTGRSLKNLEKFQNKGSLNLEFSTIYLEDNLEYHGDLECHGTLQLGWHDLVIHGNFETDSSLNNPGTLDIYENCTFTGGTACLGTGIIHVRKNLRLRERAALSMTEPSGNLLVEGDFKTSSSGTSDLRAGTIELKGNLTCTQSAGIRNMEMAGTTLALSGDQKQTIDLYAGKSCFKVARVDLSRANAVYITGGMMKAKYVKGFEKITNQNLVLTGVSEKLEQDEYFHGSLQILGDLVDCNGYRFIIDGGLELADTVCILNQGMLSAGDNFSMFGKSILKMTQSQDQLIVGGTFRTVSTLCHSTMLTDGRMILGGNFREEGDPYSFDSKKDFTVAFVSTDKQYVRFNHPETSQIANTEGDYIEDYTAEERLYQVVDAVSYGIADGLGELLESPEELVVAAAGAAAATLGVTLGIPGAGVVLLVLGIADSMNLLIETYTEMSESDNKLEQLRIATKEVTKMAVLSAAMKAGEKAGENAGKYISDSELWQRCCKVFRRKDKADITNEDLKKIAMTTTEHMESVRGYMNADVFDALLRYHNKYAEVDAMDVTEIIQTIHTRTGKALELPDIKILYQRLADDADADAIYHILAVTERFRDSDHFYQNFELEVGKDASLSIEEKIWKLQKGYRNVADQTDVMVPADARYVKGFDENGNVVYRWPKYLGFVRDSIRSITRENGLPDMMDRYGRNTGSNFATMPAGGKYAYDVRAIPYLENEKSYHKFMVDGENYCDKIDAIRGGDFKKLNEIISGEGKETITEKEFFDIKDRYTKKIFEMKSENGITEDLTYGLKGIVEQYNSRTPELPGGAEQYTLPLNANDLIKIKVLEE